MGWKDQCRVTPDQIKARNSVKRQFFLNAFLYPILFCLIMLLIPKYCLSVVVLCNLLLLLLLFLINCIYVFALLLLFCFACSFIWNKEVLGLT